MSKEILSLRILSPVHVGDGDRLTKLDFLVEGNTVKVYSFDRLVLSLNEEEIEKLIVKIEHSKNMENFEDIKKDFIIPNLKNVLMYSLPLKGKVPKEIYKHIKTFKNNELLPYIPASEIKGAIRTAIIYKYLKDNLNDSKIKDKVIKEGRFILRKIGDVMDEKFLQNFYISDPEPVDIFSMEVVEIELFNAKKKRPSEFAECLKEKTEMTFKVNIKEKRQDRDGVKNYSSYIKNWKNCCYEFSRDLIEAEKRYWRNENSEISNLLSKLEKDNNPESPLLRVGRFTGKLSHTVIPLLEKFGLYEKNKNLFPKTRRKTSDNRLLGWTKIGS